MVCLFVGGGRPGLSVWDCVCVCVVAEGGEGEAAEKGDGMSRTWTEEVAVKGGCGAEGVAAVK